MSLVAVHNIGGALSGLHLTSQAASLEALELTLHIVTSARHSVFGQGERERLGKRQQYIRIGGEK